MALKKPGSSGERLDRIVAEARQNRATREKGYREQALKLYPWICGRCAREFNRENLHELTVHHKDHDHDNNPPDGSNWELLCLYCHDNEQSRYLENEANSRTGSPNNQEALTTHNPFANLKELLKE